MYDDGHRDLRKELFHDCGIFSRVTVQQGGNSRNVANNRSTEDDVIKQGRKVSFQPVDQGEFPVGGPPSASIWQGDCELPRRTEAQQTIR